MHFDISNYHEALYVYSCVSMSMCTYISSCKLHAEFTHYPNAPRKSVLQLPTSAKQPLWIVSIFEGCMCLFLWDSLTEISGVLREQRRGEECAVQ